ncbi:DUF3313 domain-containing protein [Stenotrophomonas maltophilia]|nr:DUF3313 domain-containing protein [Stenotrophomonas maltophilia]
MHVVRSNQAKTYSGIPDSAERRTEIAPSPHLRGHYTTVTVSPTEILPKVAAGLSPGVCENLKATIYGQLQRQIIRHFGQSPAGPAKVELLLVTRITSVKEVSPGLNIATAVLVGPVSRGRLAIEVEAIDAASGKQVALLLLSDEADMRDIRSSFTRDGHAKALARRFALDAIEFIAPIIRPR